MRLKIIYILTMVGSIWLLLLSFSDGPTSRIGDRTSSPISGGPCNGCHDYAGRFFPTTTITVRDSNNIALSNNLYRPGYTYTVTVQVAAPPSTEAPPIIPVYGSQTVALALNTFAQAGEFTAPSTDYDQLGTGAKLTQLQGRTYLEHNARSNSGIFNVKWTAPAVGTGPVGLYAAGLAANNNFAFTGDDFDTTFVILQEDLSISISNLETPTLHYQVYPNPVSNYQFSIKGIEQDAELQLYNLSGKLVYQNSLAASSAPHDVQLPALPRGIYQLSIQQEQKLGTKTIFIE